MLPSNCHCGLADLLYGHCFHRKDFFFLANGIFFPLNNETLRKSALFSESVFTKQPYIVTVEIQGPLDMYHRA